MDFVNPWTRSNLRWADHYCLFVIDQVARVQRCYGVIKMVMVLFDSMRAVSLYFVRYSVFPGSNLHSIGGPVEMRGSQSLACVYRALSGSDGRALDTLVTSALLLAEDTKMIWKHRAL
jgi:hypothetical protein